MKNQKECGKRPSYTLEQIYDIVDQMPGNAMVYGFCKERVEYLYYTGGIPALSGLTREEYEQVNSLYELVMEEDRDVIKGKIREWMEHPDAQEADLLFRMNHKWKGFIWVHMTGARFAQVDGVDIYVVNMVDVTKETMISYALMEGSDRYICVIEKATKRFLYANQGFYDLIDSNPAEAMGKHCYELLCKVMEMKDNDNCLCYSSIDADPPLEMYNPEKKKYLTLKGKEVNWGEYSAYVFYMTDITDRKKKEEQLEDSNKRFNVALDNSELMIWEYDMVNHLCINSEKAGREYNIPLVIENYPESLFETGYTPPETIAQIKDVKRRLQNGETGFSVERRTVDKYGQSNWQKVEYTLECDQDGRPLRAIVCGLDITAQKELEQKYEEQMEYRNRFAENAMFSIRLDLDEDTIIDHTCTHETLEKLVQDTHSATELLDIFFQTSVFEDTSEISRERLTRSGLKETYALGRSQYQTTYRCALLNLYLDLNLSIYKNPGTGHLEVFYVITNVTDSIRKRVALQDVVNKDYDFVSLIQVDSGKMTILSHSPGAIMPAQSRENPDNYDAIMMQFATVHRDIYYSEEDYHSVSDGMCLDKIVEKLKSVPVYEFNCKTVGEEGEIHTFRMSFHYCDGSKKEIVFTRANITEAVQEERNIQMRLEKALGAARLADQAKTDFLSRMSHDMRTPMNGIIGMTRLTQDIPGLPQEAMSNLDAINDSSGYLLQLINDTLDMNKIESNRFSLKPETVDTAELIRHTIATIKPLADKKEIHLLLNMDTARFNYIHADRVRLQQILLNLLSNAVKFTPKQGTVQFTAERLAVENGVVHDRMVIEDNGRGMSREFLDHIFEPFSQERNEIISGQEGTGLGMAIVQTLIKQMGGTIEIESEPGQGTKVTVYLDFQQVQHSPDPVEEETWTQVELSGRKILLAEDHPLNATIAIRLLEKKKMQVVHGENGRRAVELFEASQPGEFDLILMDIRMPVMNGLEAAQTIRKLDREDARTIPIIAMTANAYDEDVKRTREAGIDEHLAKPVEPERLYELIARRLK